MTTAIELERAGYKVSVLEYNARPGGRNWSLRGGDVYTELGGATQKCEFDPGLYLNPGPWRIPYHHYAILDYCRRFGVPLEPFIQLNHNAYLHSANAFDGKPQRIRDIKADFDGGVAELLRQGYAERARSTTRCRRRIRRSCSRRCGRWARSTRTSAIGWARIQRLIAAMRSIPAAVSARSRSRASRSGCTIF